MDLNCNRCFFCNYQTMTVCETVFTFAIVWFETAANVARAVLEPDV